MSALQRARRSRSKTAPGTEGDIAQLNGTVPTSDTDPPANSSIPSPLPLAAPTVPNSTLKTASDNDSTMLKALSAPNFPTSNPQMTETVDLAKDGFDDPDDRSSSLSELGDGSDDHSEATPRPPTAADFVDNDSEAETERLENTPRKLTRTATSTSIASEQLYERTPSKLSHSKTLDQEESAPPTPSAIGEDTTVGDIADGVTELNSLPLVVESESASLSELTGRKRKRSSADSSTIDEPNEEPARKRSSTAKSLTLNGDQGGVVDSSEQVGIGEELDDAEERISQLAQEEMELEERQADVAEETVSELATVANLTKPRKGGRKGKRKVDDTGDTNNEAIATAEIPDGDVDGDNDEEDSTTLDEEVSKKKTAIDQLSKIEKKFKIFREKWCDEQIAQFERELEMLKQPNCTHPEYLAMVQCVDERRAEKIAYEKQLLDYKQKCLEIRTVAERHQIHSQYFQTVRDIRETILSECNQRVYELQRGRRQLGVDEIEYAVNFPEKRSEQVRQQAAYNLEVSILSGVAKYVGFPAAPDLTPARPSEIEDDLRAMKITTRSAPLPYVRPYNRTSTADEAAAEEQFIERTPWANPQHPAHHQTHYPGVSGGLSQMSSQIYHTPTGQRRIVDVHAPNGFASTIEVMSNPPSSTAGQGLTNISNGRAGESESPVLQMKRHPSDHPLLSETSGSQSRNFVTRVRESYAGNSHLLSSPAATHAEAHPDERDGHSVSIGARWSGNGVRPLNAGAPAAVTPGPSIPGRPEAGRVPLTQLNTLGAVSVVSGSGLFGR